MNIFVLKIYHIIAPISAFSPVRITHSKSAGQHSDPRQKAFKIQVAEIDLGVVFKGLCGENAVFVIM